MLSAGQLIWASCRPLIRLMLCVIGGFILTKTNKFPPVAARGAGQITLNIALPCLMFSKIVPAFTADNIHALGERSSWVDFLFKYGPTHELTGPLVLVAIVYEAIGLLMAWVIKQFFWVPHRFRHGILVAGGWGNVGDIPTSVIVSVTGAPPFNAAVDQNLSIAYISAFILIFMITLFPLGGSRLIAMDFVGPDVEPGKVKETVRRRRQAFLYAVPNAISRLTERYRSDTPENTTDFTDVEKSVQPAEKPSNYQSCENDPDIHGLSIAIATSTGQHVTLQGDFTSVDGNRSPMYSRTPREADVGSSLLTFQGPTAGDETLVSSHEDSEHGPIANTSIVESSLKANNSSSTCSDVTPVSKRRVQFLRSFASTLLTPASITILLAFLIALIPPLKGLFTPLPVSNSTSTFANPHIHPAPDNLPPLSIILDTTTFIGAASIPLGLICLGSALARLEIPRNQWGTLPTSAITLLAVGKMVVAPVLGVGIVQGLVTGGMISEDDKLLQFVCIFFSCLPTATTQVYLTQVFSGTGSAEHLPAFLIPQYILMFISMTALTAYALQLLF